MGSSEFMGFPVPCCRYSCGSDCRSDYNNWECWGDSWSLPLPCFLDSLHPCEVNTLQPTLYSVLSMTVFSFVEFELGGWVFNFL